MRDGRTRKVEGSQRDESFESFLAEWNAVLVLVSGPAAGTEHALESKCTTLGRGPDVDVCLGDSSVSQEHAAVEFVDGAFRIRDLGSMNGTIVNGSEVKAGELKHGDRIQLGEEYLRFVLEKCQRKPKTVTLPSE